MHEMRRRDVLRTGAGAATTVGLATLGLSSAAEAGQGEAADEVDYIVIGSGPGGAPLAATLAAAGHTVLVLEAGPAGGDKTLYEVPSLHHKVGATDTEIRWDFYVQHYSDTKFNATSSQWVPGKGILYPRASTLGGCTAHNAMVTMYPEESDWANIQRLTGDDSWSPERMWGHWKRLQEWQPIEFFALADAVRLDPQLGAIVAAAEEEARRLPGGGVVDDPMGVNELKHVRNSAQGLFRPPQSSKNGRRHAMRERLLSAARRYPGRLLITTDALVERITLDSNGTGEPRATGVEYLAGQWLYGASPRYSKTTEADRARMRRRVRARKEVILAAGTYNSPQLLMLSGIGPGEHLRRHGIEVRHHLPGVGGNLQDRYEVPVVTHHPPFALLALCTFGEGFDPCLKQWQFSSYAGVFGDWAGAFNKFSSYSGSGFTAGIKMRHPGDRRAQTYVFSAPVDFRGYVPRWDTGLVKNRYTWLILKGFADSRMGTVRLRTPDPTHPPLINHRKFRDGTGGDEDVKNMIDAVRLARQINERAGKGTEVWPGDAVETDEQLDAWIRKEAWGHHASCSNPIGPDPGRGAVVDGRFRVHGVKNLRVVDASVFPEIPGLFIWAPVAIISEKAGRDILEERA